MVNKGWVTSIILGFEECILPPQTVVVDYENLPIKCRASHIWTHKVKYCTKIKAKTKRIEEDGGQHMLPTHSNKTKGKGVHVEQEGFQQVENRKAKKNTFNTKDY